MKLHVKWLRRTLTGAQDLIHLQRIVLLLFLGWLVPRLAPAQSNCEPYSFTTIAGKTGSAGSADKVNQEARFNWPLGVALDGADNLYVTEYANSAPNPVNGRAPALTGSVIGTFLNPNEASISTIASPDAPPDLGILPAAPSCSPNGSVTLTVKSGGSGVLYQWQFNGVALPGQTNRTLRLANLQSDQAGQYSVVVTAGSQVTTNSVELTVDTTFTKVIDCPITKEATWAEACSWGDLDGDGRIDLLITRTGNSSGPDLMYRNQGDGRFAKVTNGVTRAGTGRSIGTAWADIDNNGTLDLAVGECCGGADKLFSNTGDGNFVRLPGASFPYESNSTRSVGWADYDRDGYVDLFILNQSEKPSFYRNDGDGTFTRIKVSALIAEPLDAVQGSWCDYDGDMYPDLLTGSFPNRARLFHNNGDGSFTRLTQVPFDSGPPSWGISWGDYDNDGHPDIFLAGWNGNRNSLIRNNGDGTFTDVDTGPVVSAKAVSCFSGIWGDYDNDGYQDLFVSNYGSDPNGECNFLFRNDRQGGFTQILTGSPANEVATSTGCAWADYDDDGFLDLVVMNWNNFTPYLYHNNGNPNHWLKFKLIGTASNRAAIGAKVRVKADIWGQTVWQLREVSGGGGYASQNDSRPNFGLGDATNVALVRIEWPSGQVQEFTNLPVRQFLTIWEPPDIQAAHQENGACCLTITAEPNRTWRIEASEDLNTWQPLSTKIHPEPTFSVTDAESTGMTCRFYRVVAE